MPEVSMMSRKQMEDLVAGEQPYFCTQRLPTGANITRYIFRPDTNGDDTVLWLEYEGGNGFDTGGDIVDHLIISRKALDNPTGLAGAGLSYGHPSTVLFLSHVKEFDELLIILCTNRYADYG